MTRVLRDAPETAVDVDVLVIGAGACGLTAALAAADGGASALVVERDRTPLGSTSMSTGQIPAAGTRFQRALGIADDSPERLASDIMAENRGTADPALVDAVAHASAPTVEWMADDLGVELTLVTGFSQHGHSRLRMHAPPGRSGRELHSGLLTTAQTRGIEIVTSCLADTLYATEDGTIRAVGVTRPDGSHEAIGCGTLVLACHGFAGNPELMRQHCPEIADAFFYGHAGNTGEAVLWGEQLGAALGDLGSCQCHASIAFPHALQITWGTMREGGIQVNLAGERFGDESRSYSTHGYDVIAQPEGLAWNIFDDRIHAVASQIDEFRRADASGAVLRARDVHELAARTGLELDTLRATLTEAETTAGRGRPDRFGRRFDPAKLLRPPYRAVKVAGAVLMTQGGLCVDGDARVQRRGGGAFSNLFAGGGAARGISGPSYWGYFSGAGLLTAVTLGRAAGRAAARQVAHV